MDGDLARAHLHYAAWRGARVAALLVTVPVAALSIVGAGMLGGWAATTRMPVLAAGAGMFGLAQVAVFCFGYRVLRARGALELIRRNLRRIALAASMSIAATAASAVAAVTSGASTPWQALGIAAVPALAGTAALALAGFPLLAFRHAWDETEAELRAAEEA